VVISCYRKRVLENLAEGFGKTKSLIFSSELRAPSSELRAPSTVNKL
jgi:hypothetical protein